MDSFTNINLVEVNIYQALSQASGIEVGPNTDTKELIASYRKITKAYQDNKISIMEFTQYGYMVRTLLDPNKHRLYEKERELLLQSKEDLLIFRINQVIRLSGNQTLIEASSNLINRRIDALHYIKEMQKKVEHDESDIAKSIKGHLEEDIDQALKYSNNLYSDYRRKLATRHAKPVQPKKHYTLEEWSRISDLNFFLTHRIRIEQNRRMDSSCQLYADFDHYISDFMQKHSISDKNATTKREVIKAFILKLVPKYQIGALFQEYQDTLKELLRAKDEACDADINAIFDDDLSNDEKIALTQASQDAESAYDAAVDAVVAKLLNSNEIQAINKDYALSNTEMSKLLKNLLLEQPFNTPEKIDKDLRATVDRPLRKLTQYLMKQGYHPYYSDCFGAHEKRLFWYDKEQKLKYHTCLRQ